VASLRASGPRAGRRPQADAQHRNYPQHDGYCWTHGYDVAPAHNSETCKHPRPGHKRNATKDNMQGGSTIGLSQRT
jgi:hypothetical protein